jgi:hypothetical protein
MKARQKTRQLIVAALESPPVKNTVTLTPSLHEFSPRQDL